jgi:nucleoside-triphosphatase
MTPKESKIWIITGPCQVGKTHFCNHLIKQAQTQGLALAGVICPPVIVEQEKTAISIEDLKSGERKILAKKRTTETEGLLTERWSFDEESMSWGNRVLAETRGCDLLLVDELGPLEFKRGEGWQNGLLAIDNGDYKIAVVVIRPVLVEIAMKRWPSAHVVEILPNLTDENMQQMINSILQF